MNELDDLSRELAYCEAMNVLDGLRGSFTAVSAKLKMKNGFIELSEKMSTVRLINLTRQSYKCVLEIQKIITGEGVIADLERATLSDTLETIERVTDTRNERFEHLTAVQIDELDTLTQDLISISDELMGVVSLR